MVSSATFINSIWLTSLKYRLSAADETYVQFFRARMAYRIRHALTYDREKKLFDSRLFGKFAVDQDPDADIVSGAH